VEILKLVINASLALLPSAWSKGGYLYGNATAQELHASVRRGQLDMINDERLDRACCGY
jgi:hypothetical protein